MGRREAKYIWNHRAHQRWADEDLSFWRLAFFPRYVQSSVLETIERVTSQHKVHSYAVYETLGLFDIFIRAWLPRQSLEKFEEAMNTALQGEYLQLLESFTVTRILRHHVWDNGGGRLREPDPSVLQSPLRDADIAGVNSGSLGSRRVADLEADNLIAPLKPQDGIKFFTIITSPVYSTTFGARTRLEHDLLDLLRESEIREPSLYEGSGFGRFVVMGKAPSDNFFAIPQLATAINELGIYESFTARPYTHVCARKSMLLCTEEIPTSASHSAIDIDDLLSSPESHELEVKASLRVDWARWLTPPPEQALISNDDVANEGVIKAIVGMLNADGGTIVLGAIERSRIFGKHRAEDHPLLRDFDRVGDYIVVGVDDEERFRSKSWDGFQLQLQDLIASRIEPSPAGLINVAEERVGNRTLCILSVQPSATTWYYRLLGKNQAVKFYVRENGRTVAFAGSEADNYKRARPRG
jgi:hypothetical protein